MRVDMRKRLHELEGKAKGGPQVVCVNWYADEPEDAAQDRYARWQRGEQVQGVTAMPSSKDDLVVYLRRFGTKKPS